MLLSGLSLGLLFVSAGLAAQNPTHPGAVAPKYRTHFVTYDVQKKSTTTIFTIEGEWHAPNWTTDGKYVVSDMGGSIVGIAAAGAMVTALGLGRIRMAVTIADVVLAGVAILGVLASSRATRSG